MAKVKIQGHASGTGILTVTAPNTSTDRTITLPDSTGTILDENSSLPAANLTGTVADARISALTASKLTGALPAISGASLTGIAGVGKNIIINGAMKVAQRGTSVSVAANDGFEYGACDRMLSYNNSAAAFDFKQSSTVPSGEGFANSLEIDVTTADSSIGAADRFNLAIKIEGQDLQHLKKGTASAESVTLSFWVRSPKTGIHILELYEFQNARQISKPYTIASADTWQKVEITFAGDTTGAFNDDNGQGLGLYWWLIAGSEYTSGTLSETWSASSGANRAVGQVNVVDSTSNNFYITGIKLEVGTSATDFEHRSYGEELALCQRYYEQTTEVSEQFPLPKTRESDRHRQSSFQFKVTKRVNPTITLLGANTDGGGGALAASGIGTYAFRGTSSGSGRGDSSAPWFNGYIADSEL